MAKIQSNNTTYTDIFGNEYTSGLYAMVEDWRGNKGSNRSNIFKIAIFKDEATRDAWENGDITANPIDIPSLRNHLVFVIDDRAVLDEHFVINGEHPVSQFYEWLNNTNHEVWSVWTDSI